MGLCQSQVGSFPQQALVSKAYARRWGVIRFAYETQISIPPTGEKYVCADCCAILNVQNTASLLSKDTENPE